MLTHLETEEMLRIVRAGGGLEVSARRVSPEDLEALARALRNQAVLHVVNSQRLTAEQMETIAHRAEQPAYVLFSGRQELPE